MRALVILICCGIAGVAHAQFSLAAKAGYNTTTPVFTGNNKPGYDVQNGGGWQAGLYAERSLHKWFIYTGAGVVKNSFGTRSYYLGGDVETYYHPLYIDVSLGTGYQLSAGKNFAIKLYGGVYGQLGVAGKVKTINRLCGDYIACTEPPPGVTNVHNIDFKSGMGTLARTNAGLQFGAGLRAFNKVELVFMCNAGLGNVMPPGYNYTMHLTTVSINAKYALIPFGKGR